jgi:hypothetical protein
VAEKVLEVIIIIPTGLGRQEMSRNMENFCALVRSSGPVVSVFPEDGHLKEYPWVKTVQYQDVKPDVCCL